MKDTNIDGYEIKRRLGVGGMATVWLARQCSLDRMVAIKILGKSLASDAEDVARFGIEARVAARLKHPGIVQVIDAGAQDDTYYFVMEYIDGYTVGDWCRRKGRLSESNTLDVAECVADALGYAWDLDKVVHCDIKPDNVMVDADGTVKVMDLGLARTLIRMHAILPQDEVMGTPAYMSPEQAMGDEDLDFRADIYSLGAMLYHVLTGRMLFQDVAEDDVMDKHISGDDLDICEHNRSISGPISYLIEKMLAKSPADRHASWAEVSRDLARVRMGRMPAGDSLPLGRSTIQRSDARPKTKSIRPVLRMARDVVLRRGLKIPGSAQGNPYRYAAGILVILLILLLSAAAFIHIFGGGGEEKQTPPVAIPYVEETNNVADANAAANSTNAVVTASVDTNRTETSTETLTEAEKYEMAASQAYQDAVQYENDNPRHVVGAIEKYEHVMNTYIESDMAEKAAVSLGRLKAKQKRFSQRRLAELKAEADALVRANKVEEALLLLREYKGPMARHTQTRREEMASQIEEEQRIWREYLNAVVLRAAESLYVGNAAKASQRLHDAEKDRPELLLCAEYIEVENLINGYSKVDEIVLKSLKADVGKVVELQLDGGTRLNGKLMLVSEENLVLGRLDSSAQMYIALSRLSWRECLKRIPEDQAQVITICKALVALREKNEFIARELLKGIPQSLAESLLIVMEREK